MIDPVYDKYIAQFRVMIESYGAQNAIYALEKAFELESQEARLENDKKYLERAAEATGKLYCEVEKL